MSCGATSNQRSMSSLKMQWKMNETTRTVDLALLATLCYISQNGLTLPKVCCLWTTAPIRPLQATLSIATLPKKRKETIETKKEKCKNFWSLSQAVCITDMYSRAGQWNALISEMVFCRLSTFSIEMLGYHAFHRSAEGTIQNAEHKLTNILKPPPCLTSEASFSCSTSMKNT